MDCIIILKYSTLFIKARYELNKYFFIKNSPIFNIEISCLFEIQQQLNSILKFPFTPTPLYPTFNIKLVASFSITSTHVRSKFYIIPFFKSNIFKILFYFTVVFTQYYIRAAFLLKNCTQKPFTDHLTIISIRNNIP